MKLPKVLIVATSRKTRGGITSVIKAYETQPLWKKFHCRWVQSHRDGSIWRKIFYFISGLIEFIIIAPFYDIVHIHTADYGTQIRKTIFSRLAKVYGKKLIIHLHSCDQAISIGGKYKKLYRYSFTKADKIILLSNDWLDIAKENFSFSRNRMCVLYNPCPSVIPSKIDEREKYILYAGTLIERKGYTDLIKAFARIASRYPEWRLKFAGNGEIENGKNLALQLNIANQVDFLGWIDGIDKDFYFRHASIYCLPSYSEGFPMGVLDAWAYNLPVMTTPVGGVRDVAIDGENILLFNPGDIAELSNKLEKIMTDSVLYDKLTNESRAFSQCKFNILEIAQTLDSIYSSLAE